MGFFRFILATVILVQHGGLALFSPLTISVTVEIFFLISGFYMQLIINNYVAQDAGTLKFYMSRLWRLMPLYYLVLICSFLFVCLCGSFEKRMLCQGQAGAVAFCVFSNLFIIGQDALRFMTFDGTQGQIHFALSHYTSKPPQYDADYFILLPQAWTLALELMFYALVPFLLRRSNVVLIMIILTSMALKFTLQNTVWRQLNHNCYYDFFPAEVGVFLLGALSCRIKRTPAQPVKSRRRKPGFIGSVEFYIVFLMLLNMLSMLRYGDFVLLGGMALVLPELFQRQSKLDSMMGECSYPIYIIHYLILGIVQYMGLKGHGMSAIPKVTVTFAITIGLAVLYIVYIDKPLTRMRHERFRRVKEDTIAAPA